MPRQSSQTKPRRNKREEILQSAMRVFCHYGFDGSTLDKIAGDAGVSKALVIKYYGNQRAMLLLCMSRFLEEFFTRVEENAQLPGKTYEEHCDFLFERFQEFRPQFKLLISMLVTPAHDELCKELITQYFVRIQAVMAHFPQECAPELGMELNYTYYSLLVLYTLGGNEDNFRRVREQMFTHFLREREQDAPQAAAETVHTNN